MDLRNTIAVLSKVASGERFSANELIEAAESAIKLLQTQKGRNIKTLSIPMLRIINGKITERFYIELCPSCNTVVEHKDKYCYRCGQHLVRYYTPKHKI